MTIKEYRKKIEESVKKEWWETKDTTLDLPHLGIQSNFKGIVDAYSFFRDEAAFWKKLDTTNNPTTTNWKNIIIRLEEEFLNLLEFVPSLEHVLNRQYNHNINPLISSLSSNTYFPSNSPELKFLLSEILHFNQNFFKGALIYLSRQDQALNRLQNIDTFKGFLMAYQFDTAENSIASIRTETEQESFQNLRLTIKETIQNSKKEFENLINNSSTTIIDFIENFKSDSESLKSIINTWLDSVQGEVQEFQNSSEEIIKELEITYGEKLKLEKPAQYWEERANKMQTQAWWALTSLIGLVGIACFLLYQILWQAPEEIYASFFAKDKSAAIRWSIIFIALLSFLAFAIRSVAKVMFSSFHLSRDAQERYTLTYFYLSLLKDASLEKDDRKLVLQSLFSRSDTGLLKEDSGPTMPTDHITKVTSK